LVNEVTLLFDLQSGVNGFHGSTHGGLMSVLLDEAMGNLLFIHNSIDSSLRSLGQTIALDVFNFTGLAAMTAGLSVRYLKPLKTPQIVAVTATLARIDGRSIFVDGKIENGDGVVFAKGQSEWKIVRVTPLQGRI
jgi:acyl-coenzyme A thioesterase PaaI-like protein